MAGKKRGRPPKGKYDDLDDEFKDKFATASEAEIREEAARVALDLERVREAKKEDEDLKQKKAAAREAGAGYSEQEKGAKLTLSFLRETLKSRGRAE